MSSPRFLLQVSTGKQAAMINNCMHVLREHFGKGGGLDPARNGCKYNGADDALPISDLSFKIK
jgi:hypothetical protein